jgi:hypothetical protein
MFIKNERIVAKLEEIHIKKEETWTSLSAPHHVSIYNGNHL